jgi:predicted CXXCH cytochrome family protein
MRSPMARSSGAVTGSLGPAAFGEYRIAGRSMEMGGWKKEFAYFVGSGATARGYLIAADGFLFEAPVAYYPLTKKWALAPGYERYGYPYVTRPILPGCLTCHATSLQPTANTQNGYRAPPFLEGGVACERCHAKTATHYANPAKLAADRRDSICAQCHLSGEARVMRAGADWQSYRPGDRLSDSTTVFVRPGGSAMQVTSHVENLAQSRCKQSSSDRLWCGTCHDPHGAPDVAAIQRTCQGCHVCKAKQTARCIECHMPKSPVGDAQHVVYTDHSIPLRPRALKPPSKDAELVVFGGGKPSPRDLGLAYAIAGQPDRARLLLESAPLDRDPEAQVYLAEIYRIAGDIARAAPLYERALAADPAQVTAMVGLGAIRFQQQRDAEAIRLWSDALARNPGLDLTRTNLAMAQWRSGDRAGAQTTLRKGLDLSPGFRPAIDLLQKLK